MASMPGDPGPAGSGRALRVAYVAPALHPGGAERQMLTLAALLPRSAFDVRFVLLWQRGPWADRAEALGASVEVLGLHRGRCLRPRCLLAVARAIVRYVRLVRDVDLVDAWLVPAYTFAGLLQPIARAPVLIAGRRSMADVYRHKPWYRRLAARLATRAVAAVVANSTTAAHEAIAEEGLPRERVHVIPNGVAPMEAGASERSDIRREWAVGEDDIVVGCVSNLKPGKGVDDLVRLAADVHRDAPNLRFVLVGGGPMRSQLAALIEQLGLPGIVVLHGPEPDARRLYPAFDVVAHVSASEGLPNVVLEAAAAGRPIVATAVGGTTDVLTSEVNGLLVPYGDGPRLREAILRLAHDPALRDRLGAAARARSADFSPQRLVESTARLYRELTTRRGLGVVAPAGGDA